MQGGDPNLTVLSKNASMIFLSMCSDKKSGAIHVMYFYGFLLVQFGIDLIWKEIVIDSHLPLGPLYPFFTFSQEIVVLMILVATIGGFYRCYIEKLARLLAPWFL